MATMLLLLLRLALRASRRWWLRASFPVARRSPRFLRHSVFLWLCGDPCPVCDWRARMGAKLSHLLSTKEEREIYAVFVKNLQQQMKLRALRPPKGEL